MTKFNEIEELLKEEVGKYFLGLIHFSEESEEVIYIDNKVENKHPKKKITKIIEKNFIKQINSNSTQDILDLSSLNTTVLSFENEILMIIRLNKNEKLVVFLDKEASMLQTPCELLGKIKRLLN